MGNANKKAKKEAAQQLAANQTANAAAFMRANQKAIDDEANRQAADLARAQEDDRLARLRDAEMAERAAHLAALKEEAETKVFFSNLLKEDAKIEEEKMKKKKKEKKERQKKKREAEEQLENFEKANRQGLLKDFGFVEFPLLATKDMVNGEWFRCDQLIKAHLERIQANKAKLDGMNKGEMDAVIREFDMKSPIANNNLTEPFYFKYNARLRLLAEAAEEDEVEDEIGQGAQATAAVLAVVNDWEEEEDA